MNFWRAQHQIHGHSLHEHQLAASSGQDCAQTERIEYLLSADIMPHSTDSASDSSTPPIHVTSVCDSFLFAVPVNTPQNDLGDLVEDVRDHKPVGQFQLISTKPFQNSLCARHAVEDAIELLSTESEPKFQVGVFAGVGLAQPIQANHDEPSRGLRRVGQLPLRKLKIAREKKKEEARQRRKDAGDKAVRMLTTKINKEPTGELSVEDKQKVKFEAKASDELEENASNLSEEEAGDVEEKEVQDEQQEGTGDEPEKKVKVEPEVLGEPVEPLIQLGLSCVVLQPMNFALSRFTEGQRMVIAMIDRMMEELHMVLLGPSAWCEKP